MNSCTHCLLSIILARFDDSRHFALCVTETDDFWNTNSKPFCTSLLVTILNIGDTQDKTCRPFPAGTKVEIWHCDFHGVYSGFKVDPNGKYEVDTEGQTFVSICATVHSVP